MPGGELNEIAMGRAVNDWVGLGRRAELLGKEMGHRWKKHGVGEWRGKQAGESLDNVSHVICSDFCKEARIRFTIFSITGYGRAKVLGDQCY